MLNNKHQSVMHQRIHQPKNQSINQISKESIHQPTNLIKKNEQLSN